MASTTAYYTSIYFPGCNAADGAFGPVLQVTTETDPTGFDVISDGVTIVNPINLGTIFYWTLDGGNPTALQVVYETLLGMYQYPGDATPTDNNIAVYAASKESESADWNGTYQCSDQNGNELDQVVISGSTVTYGGTTVKNPLFLSQPTDSSTQVFLSWFTSDGNAQNASVFFILGTDDGSGVIPNDFSGFIWDDGTNRPRVTDPPNVDIYNFFGTTLTDSGGDGVNDLALAAAGIMTPVVAAAMVMKTANANEEEEAEDEAENYAEEGEEAGEEANEEAANEAAAEEGGEEAAADAGGEAAADEAGEAAVEVGLEAAAEDAVEVLIAVVAILMEEADLSPKMEDAPKGKPGSSVASLLELKNKQ